MEKMKIRARKVFIGSLILPAVSISAYVAIPVYLVPVSEMLNISIGQLALLFSFLTVAGLITSIFLGQLFKLLKVRAMVIIAAIALAAFFASIFFAKGVIPIYVTALLFGYSTVAGGFGVAQTEITWWFSKNTAKLISFLSISLGVASFILPPVIANAIPLFGLRNVALAHGLIVGCVMIVTALFLLSEHPASYGYTIANENAPPEQKKAAEQPAPAKALSLKEILMTGPFWLILLAIILLCVASTGYNNNASSFYQSRGLSAVQAAFCISALSAAGLFGAALFGALVDKLGVGIATAICGTAGAAAFFVATVISGFPGALAIAIIMGLALTFNGMLGAIAYSRVYGVKEAGSLIGFGNAAGNIGAVLGAPVAGYIFDQTGAYTPFLIVGGVCIILCVLFIFIGSKKSYDA
jgi:sugar phosphate permease